MDKTIYLAGFISTKSPQSMTWRVIAHKRLETKFNVLSPLRHKLDLDSSQDGGMTVASRTDKDIILRDYSDICRSDILLAHLENFGELRPLIGTVVELAWAWQMKKPVVAICYPENQIMLRHPFITDIVSHYFSSVDEATDFLNGFWA